jgi:hypothetical protein
MASRAMEIIKLNGLYSLSVETENKRLMLIIFNGDEELVCHKTGVSELKRFLQQSEAHLFKGRLQLDKTNGNVTILIRAVTIGVIPEVELASLMNNQALVIL